MRSLVIKHLAKCTDPLGRIERDLDELREIYPTAERLHSAKFHVLSVGADLQKFLRGREDAAKRYEERQNAANG